MLLIGDRFAIVNTEEEEQPPPDRLVIRLTPSHSYGHGWADDTVKMLAALERHVKPGDTVLDVGAGVGTLALAALALGAHFAAATEPDPEALAALERNVKANGVEDRLYIHKSMVPPEGPFDVVACNIGSWEQTGSLFDGLARAARRALIMSSESTNRELVKAHALRRSMRVTGTGRAFNLSRAHDPSLPDWDIQELVR